MTLHRRFFIRATGGLITLAAVSSLASAIAQDFPSRAITVVVPYAAGAAPDLIVRMLVPKLSAGFGQPVIVENKPGASGNIGAAYVAKAPADGYTVLLATQPMVSINPHLFKNMGFDPLKDLTPITAAVNVVMAISVNPSVPATNVAELIDYVRKNPGTPYGTSGVGTPMHLTGLKLNRLKKIELNHIPYRGGALVLNDLIAGTIKVGIVDLASSKPFSETGKLRIIAIGEPTRFSGTPDTPTLSETLPGFDLTAWFGFFGPSNLPSALTQRWNVELQKALQDPETSSRLHGMGIITRSDGPVELERLVRSDYEAFGRVVKENGVTVD